MCLPDTILDAIDLFIKSVWMKLQHVHVEALKHPLRCSFVSWCPLGGLILNSYNIGDSKVPS